MPITHLKESLLQMMSSEFVCVKRLPVVSGEEALLKLVSLVIADFQFIGSTIS
jgi:hypothetical protein